MPPPSAKRLSSELFLVYARRPNPACSSADEEKPHFIEAEVELDARTASLVRGDAERSGTPQLSYLAAIVEAYLCRGRCDPVAGNGRFLEIKGDDLRPFLPPEAHEVPKDEALHETPRPLSS